MISLKSPRLWWYFLGCALVVFIWQSQVKVTPMHADEAVQWSLAKDLSEGTPYSANEDRFHGPTLAMATWLHAKVAGESFKDLTPEFLRFTPQLFLAVLALSVCLVRGVNGWIRVAWILTLGFAETLTPYGRTYIQEMLLVAGFVWGVVLFTIARHVKNPRGYLLLAGLCFGWALACKVTAVAYLTFFLAAGLWLHGASFTRKNLIWLGAGLLFGWTCFQSVLFTDLHGLVTWWHQLARAFGVAAGLSEDSLWAESYWPWFWTGGWLLAVSMVRWWSRSRLGHWRESDADLPLVIAWLIYLFHTALPYKTPWLLLTSIGLTLALVVPILMMGRQREQGFLFLSLGLLAFTSPRVFVHSQTLPEVVKFSAATEQVAHDYGPKQFYIAIEGGHYWPLPYYLRKFAVGYGSFPTSEKAPVRLVPVVDNSQPAVEGYQAVRLHLRTGEDYWVLVAKDFKGPLMEFATP
jgi:hypothetical protein